MSRRYGIVLILLAVAVMMMFGARERKRYFTSEGVVWTTDYHITYEAQHDLGDSIQLILNNLDIVTGGREQSRTDTDENGESIRTYSFQNSPYKFYANGANGMLMINYYF